jgi:hypothetical protein
MCVQHFVGRWDLGRFYIANIGASKNTINPGNQNKKFRPASQINAIDIASSQIQSILFVLEGFLSYIQQRLQGTTTIAPD